MKAYLATIYDTAKSFGQKAILSDEEKKGVITLTSFTTTVAEIEGNEARVFDWYSQSTARHINEFLQQNGFRKLTKKEMTGGITLKR